MIVFADGLCFPLWDAHGNIVGFTGRVLVETEKVGGKICKYSADFGF